MSKGEKAMTIKQLQPRLTRQGRRWCATLGPLQRSANTKANALAIIQEEVVAQVENAVSPTIIHCPDGRTVIVVYYAGAWCYDISDPSRSCPCTAITSEVTRTAAIELAKRHAQVYC